MRKALIGIAAIIIATISTSFGVPNAQASNNTYWVNDEAYGNSDGYHLDPLSCQIWTPVYGWHYRTPGSSPIWVNAPYGSAESGGGFYWDSVSCQVWTADSGWHTFNVAGIWPSDSAPTAPADSCARHLAKGETARVESGCLITGDVKVSNGHKDGPWEDLSYDTDTKTGTLVIVTNPLWVHAAYGSASVQSIEHLEEAIHEMRKSGCENGCDWVNITTR